jgi:N-acetylglutamate synthase-like GNAT family acetyltransferase
MKHKDELTLRAITGDDREFLLRVYEASRETELAAVEWDAALKRAFLEHQFDAQDRHYREHYIGASFDIIQSGGVPCGRLLVHRGESQIAIMDLTILPEFRLRGIGAEMVRRIVDEAAGSRRSVRVFLEAFNPHQAFFMKRGFAVVEDDGVSRRYEWRASETA